MRAESRAIIAEPSPRPAAGRVALLAFLVAVLIGTTGAIHYARAHLTLSHYDARAHLVVSRRIVDSLTPGWRQLGAVWLPLPHLLDLPLVASDWGYRTGFPAVALSVVALATGLAAMAWLIVTTTGSRSAALLPAFLVLLNPNVLYLQSTPMTEPLLFGLSFLAVALTARWLQSPSPTAARAAGIVLFALMWTRYEGWCVAGSLAALSIWARWRDGARWTLLPSVAGAALLFLLLGWASTGQWFTASGFFVPDNPARHNLTETLRQVREPLEDLASSSVLLAAIGGVALLLFEAARHQDPARLAPLALLSVAALPLTAFFAGHPHRVRYMIPLVAAAGVLAAWAVARLPRVVRPIVAIGLVAIAVFQRAPFDAHAPMVLEAQWETPFRIERETVTRYLASAYDGTPILASMGSLGHYMQESAQAGFHLRDFLHEGNGDLWTAAIAAPARHVHWMLIEERAEGGDQLAGLARTRPEFLKGFSRVAAGGGLVLYRRDASSGD